MKISELNDDKLIKDFLERAGGNFGAEFLVSLDWAIMFKNIKVHGVFSDDNELLAILNLKRQEIKLGFYYYSARGPIILKSEVAVWHFLADYVKKTGAIFWRVEPLNLPSDFSFKKTIDLQPRKSLIIDLSKSEEDLLQDMHQKTRYNIRLAEKKELILSEGKTALDFENFWSLMQSTGERDSFRVHDKKHYQILATANPDFIKLFLIKSEGKCLAAGLFSFYANKVTYLHGASDHKLRQLMAPYLLQWRLIKMARESSFLYYDFYGIDAQKWPGVTRFKLGFGGREVVYAGTNDLVFKSLKYNLYSLLRQIRRLI